MNCSSTGCPHAARWLPKLLIYPPLPLQGGAPALLALPLCDACRLPLSINDLLTDEGFAAIAEGYRQARKIVPDRARTELTWVALDSPDPMVRMMRERAAATDAAQKN